MKYLLAGLVTFFLLTSFQDDWGFFGHRRINRLAVFTLPPEMIVFFKKNIEYITEQSTAPDKRRYASKFEGVRHYMDLDRYGEPPFDQVPRNWTDALMQYTDIFVVKKDGDTTLLPVRQMIENENFRKPYRIFFIENIVNNYYEEDWTIDCEKLKNLPGLETTPCIGAFAKDNFSEHGILPYHLEKMQRQLTTAFMERDADKILRLAAEIGHYIGDAHVPLHTTENYNGQLSNQLGIHAFWESRLPELFADETYDFWVGKAERIEDPETYFWNIVLESHALVRSVLDTEKSLSKTFPADRQYCFEDRLGQTVRLECAEYAAAFQEQMSGMVESRMRAAVLAVGSSWYTAWLDAGKPDLENIYEKLPAEQEEEKDLEKKYREGKILGREHGG